LGKFAIQLLKLLLLVAVLLLFIFLDYWFATEVLGRDRSVMKEIFENVVNSWR